jgi:F-type H+-transporting ATPase subunit a
MNINPDKTVYLVLGSLSLNATIVDTWAVMALIIGLSVFLSRGIGTGPDAPKRQYFLEAVLSFLEGQVRTGLGADARPFLPFLGALFIFVFSANVLEILPLFHPPTASLSTTAALAACVFFAVPLYGVKKRGLAAYLRDYIEPSALMLPFNVISELSRTVSLAVRLFGNMMSEGLVAAALLAIVPFFVPAIMQAFGLVIGAVQAYIFFTLASVYIGAAITVSGGDRPGEVRKEAT